YGRQITKSGTQEVESETKRGQYCREIKARRDRSQAGRRSKKVTAERWSLWGGLSMFGGPASAVARQEHRAVGPGPLSLRPCLSEVRDCRNNIFLTASARGYP